MIKVKVKYFNNNIEIEFPIDESNLLSQFQALSKNEIEKQLVASKRIKCLINEVIEPKDLSAIKDSVVNLDELNYLAKRMGSFVDKEFKQFYAAANCFGINKIKDLINLTFNLQLYTLIQDFSSKENIGKTHLLNKLGGMSEEEMEKTDFASVGRELINSGKGKITEYGLLFENIDVPLEDVYDGQVFPLYVYKDCVAIVGIKFKEKTEYAYLPCDDIEIDKAVKKIVIINRSPRKTGNTSDLVKSFKEGAESVGNEVTVFRLNSMNINGCKGCFGGHSSKGKLWFYKNSEVV